MSETTIILEQCLARIKNGELIARDDLITRVSRRLEALARRMMRDNPRVARWEDVDDLVQQANVRIHRALAEFVPSTSEEFFRFAALQLRRELKDMARHHLGPNGLGAHQAKHDSRSNRSADQAQCHDPSDSSSDPHKLAIWTEFHAAVEKLPEIEKRVFDLLWYHELTQSEAAKLLEVTERQLRRYWQSARLKLQVLMGEPEPVW